MMTFLKNNILFFGILAAFAFIAMQAGFAHYIASVTADKIDNKFIVLQTPKVTTHTVNKDEPAYRIFKIHGSLARTVEVTEFNHTDQLLKTRIVQYDKYDKKFRYGREVYPVSNDVVAWVMEHIEHPAWFCFSTEREDL